MAGELTVNCSTRYAKAGAVLPSLSASAAVNVSGTLLREGTISIGTSETEIPSDSIPLTGFIQLVNLDDAHYVEFGGATGVYQGRVNAGEPALLRMNNWTGVFAKANTAAVLVQYRIFSN